MHLLLLLVVGCLLQLCPGIQGMALWMTQLLHQAPSRPPCTCYSVVGAACYSCVQTTGYGLIHDTIVRSVPLKCPQPIPVHWVAHFQLTHTSTFLAHAHNSESWATALAAGNIRLAAVATSHTHAQLKLDRTC